MPGDLETINPGRESAAKFNRNFATNRRGNVVSSDGSILISETPVGTDIRARPLFIPPGRVSFDARITAHAQDGTNKRWLYDVTEVEPDGDNWTWNDKSGGRVVTARNRFEVPNGASGLYGNGVSSANLTGTFDIQPIPNGVIVDVEVRTAADGTTVYNFAAMNGIDGTCP